MITLMKSLTPSRCTGYKPLLNAPIPLASLYTDTLSKYADDFRTVGLKVPGWHIGMAAGAGAVALFGGITAWALFTGHAITTAAQVSTTGWVVMGGGAVGVVSLVVLAVIWAIWFNDDAAQCVTTSELEGLSTFKPSAHDAQVQRDFTILWDDSFVGNGYERRNARTCGWSDWKTKKDGNEVPTGGKAPLSYLEDGLYSTTPAYADGKWEHFGSDCSREKRPTWHPNSGSKFCPVRVMTPAPPLMMQTDSKTRRSTWECTENDPSRCFHKHISDRQRVDMVRQGRGDQDYGVCPTTKQYISMHMTGQLSKLTSVHKTECKDYCYVVYKDLQKALRGVKRAELKKDNVEQEVEAEISKMQKALPARGDAYTSTWNHLWGVASLAVLCNKGMPVPTSVKAVPYKCPTCEHVADTPQELREKVWTNAEEKAYDEGGCDLRDCYKDLGLPHKYVHPLVRYMPLSKAEQDTAANGRWLPVVSVIDAGHTAVNGRYEIELDDNEEYAVDEYGANRFVKLPYEIYRDGDKWYIGQVIKDGRILEKREQIYVAKHPEKLPQGTHDYISPGGQVTPYLSRPPLTGWEVVIPSLPFPNRFNHTPVFNVSALKPAPTLWTHEYGTWQKPEPPGCDKLPTFG